MCSEFTSGCFFAQNEYTEAGAKSCPSKLSDGNPEALIDVSAVEDINAEKSVIVYVQEGSMTKKPILVDNLQVNNMLKHVACDVASLTTQEPYLSIKASSGMLEGAISSSSRECITYHGSTEYCLPCKDSSMVNRVGGAVMNEVVSQM